MATNPLVLDAQTLKRLPVPDLSQVQQMPSANPLATSPGPTMPNVSGLASLSDPSALSPATLARLNPFARIGTSPSDQSSQSLRLLPASTSVLSSPSSGPQLLPVPNNPAVQNSQRQILGAQNQLQRMTRSGSGIHQITNPVDAQGNPTGQPVGPLRRIGGVLARMGEAAETAIAPGAVDLTPGTEAHHRYLMDQQQGVINNGTQNQQQEYQTEDMQAQAQQRSALAQQEQAKAFNLLHPKPSAGQLLYDKNGSPIGFQGGDGSFMGKDDPNLPHGVGDILGAAARKQPTNAFELWQTQNPKGSAEDYLKLSGEGKIKALPQQLLEAELSGDQHTADAIRRVIHETQVQPKIDVHTANAPAALSFGGGGNSPSGEDYLKSLPANVQNIVRSTAAGDIAIPPAGTRNPQAQALRQAVMNYDPTFTDSRYKGKQSFRAGNDSQTITQLATATEHLDNLRNNNAAVGFAPMIGESLTQASTRYNQDVKLFSQEAGKLIKSGVLTEGEYKDLKDGLMSSRQDLRNSSIDELTNLMAGKVSGVFQKYKNATGEDMPVDKFFDAPTQQRLQRFGIASSGGQPSYGQPSQRGNSSQTHSLATAMALPFNRGKSAAQVTADLVAHGYQVVP
jgi:hypothetical protein